MGINGSGKSTLSKVIAGHPSYNIIKGEILFQGTNISDCLMCYSCHQVII